MHAVRSCKYLLLNFKANSNAAKDATLRPSSCSCCIYTRYIWEEKEIICERLSNVLSAWGTAKVVFVLEVTEVAYKYIAYIFQNRVFIANYMKQSSSSEAKTSCVTQ